MLFDLTHLRSLRSYKSFITRFFFIVSLLPILFFSIGCSSSKRYDSNSDLSASELLNENIKVLLSEIHQPYKISVDSPVDLFVDEKLAAHIKSGNQLNFIKTDNDFYLSVKGVEFNGEFFELRPAQDLSTIKIIGGEYRGSLILLYEENSLKIINRLSLQDYIKGVMTKEMPVGNGKDTYEALKAFSVCVRTYALMKMREQKDFFDVFIDVRDQVYGGVQAESIITNKIVDETENEIITFNGLPAIVFYHSTCGGRTENSTNVFNTQNDLDYLSGIEDGIPPNCRISPRYQWSEVIPEKEFLRRLVKNNLIADTNYSIVGFRISDRFQSGRIKNLLTILSDNSSNNIEIVIPGKSLRSVIRKADNSGILFSNNFEITIDENRNVLLNGKGAGHGVGLCQWGSIALSKSGLKYDDILKHYFPGTEVIKSQ